MPETPCSSTWSADRKASRTLIWRSEIDEQAVVRDDDEGVDLGAQLGDAGLRRCRPGGVPRR
jgi:hypothetical protein